MIFEKLNINPKGIKTGDCVIRAIAYALDKQWDDVYIALFNIGYKMKRMPNEKQVYEKYLKQQGWTKHKQPKKIDGSKMSIEYLAKLFKPSKSFLRKSKKMLVTVPGHMTCIEWTGIEMKLVDSWNCSTRNVGNYWVLDN